MSKRFYIAFIIIGMGLLMPLYFGQDTSAISASASRSGGNQLSPAVEPYPGCGRGQLQAWEDHFDVTFSDGWKAQGKFKCTRVGCALPTTFKDISPPGESGCFEVTLEPALSNAQTIAGTMCKDEEEEEEDDSGAAQANDCEGMAPGSYSSSTEMSGTSSIISKVKNTSIGDSWKDETWAKPQDNIDWIHCYFPGAQKVANTDTTGLGVTAPGDGLHGAHNIMLPAGGTTPNGYSPLYSFYSGSWTNYFKVVADQLRNPSPNQWTGGPGDDAIQAIRDNYPIPIGRGTEPNGKGGTVELNKAGKTLIEESETGFPTEAEVRDDGTHEWECGYKPDCCFVYNTNGTCAHTPFPCFTDICHHSNSYMDGNASGGKQQDDARVKVPFNYKNVASVGLISPAAHVFAGETVEIGYATAAVTPKENSVTKGNYATHVENGRVGIMVFVSRTGGMGVQESVGSGSGWDICGAFGNEWCRARYSGIMTLNPNGNLGGDELNVLSEVNPSLTSIIDVQDAPAGWYFCVATGIYPANSGDDTNLNASGSDSWYISAPDCRVIAKKPSLQVWGAGMYTEGRVAVSNSQKHVVRRDARKGWEGFQDYYWNTTANILFGSWVEQNIITNGGLVNLASGAADGWRGVMDRVSRGSFGGSHNGTRLIDICALNTLTMPNKGCTSGSSSVGGTTNSMERPDDKEALIATFTSGEVAGNYERHETCNIDGTPSFSAKKTQTFKCNGNLTISGNIAYFSDARNYTKLTEIPKVIIYASGNIIINCNVTQIDAVLIAGGDVNTCPNNNVNSPDRGNPLKVNGVVITNKLYANRTYGAGYGNYSGLAAEVVNYDTSLYLWGASTAATSDSGKMNVVYQTELAPRL